MTKTLAFCDMEFYNNFVICHVNEGVIFSKTESRLQTTEILKHFKKEPFVYITHRIHSYTVDPSIYRETSLIKNLIGFAVVSRKTAALNNVKVEKMFLNKPLETFRRLKDAENWAKRLIENHGQLV